MDILLVAALALAAPTDLPARGPCGDTCAEKGEHAARLEAAWKSEVTTPEQRAKMTEIIGKHSVGTLTDWEGSAKEYFGWRAGEAPGRSTYTLVAPTPANNREKYRRLRLTAESAVKSRLIDPSSAEIQWAGGFMEGTWKPFLQKRIEGQIVCGVVNAKNRFGGYVGATPFVVVVRNDGGVFVDMDKSNDTLPLVGAGCSKTSFPSPQPGMMDDAPAATPVPAVAAASVADELAKLAALKEKGILTQAEFDAQKAALLKR